MATQRREQLLSLDWRQSRGGSSEVVSQQCKNVQEEGDAKAQECGVAFAGLEWGRRHAGALCVPTVPAGTRRALIVERVRPRSLDFLCGSGEAPGGLKQKNGLHSGQNSLGDHGVQTGAETGGGQARAHHADLQQLGSQQNTQ